MPANKEVAVSWGFSCVKEMADATGVDYSNIKTEEDVEKYLGEVTLVSIPYIKAKAEKKDEKKAQLGGKRGKKE